MRQRLVLLLFLLAAGGACGARAQGWDPARQARGWAFQDVDGTLVFFDGNSHALRSWQRGSGLLATQPLPLPPVRKATAPRPAPAAPAGDSTYEQAGALLFGIPAAQRSRRAVKPVAPEPPACAAVRERWVLDATNRIWAVCEDRLAVIGRDGKLEATYTLPGPVEDLAVDPGGIYLNYRTLRPYVEKRSLQNGDVVWAYGDKAALRDAAASPLLVPFNRMALGEDGVLYLAEGGSLSLVALDTAKGPHAPGQAFFTWQGQAASRAGLGRQGRGPMLVWAGHHVLMSAFDGGQLKGMGTPGTQGIVLARFDLVQGSLDWIPTSLGEGHRLVILLEHEAVVVNPEGGLSYVPIH
jgi:hypothetical protein